MACVRGLCTADKIFVFINVAFAMYSGALLATAARLAWDPSTYAWFRFLWAAQYRVSTAYLLAAGLWLAALVALAAAACLRAYACGVACLAASELVYGAWMAASFVDWWWSAPDAEIARGGLKLLQNIKSVLRSFNIGRPILDIIEEVEGKAANNVYVVVVFGAVAMLLQIAAFVTARRLARRPALGQRAAKAGGEPRVAGWRMNANLRHILDKIF